MRPVNHLQAALLGLYTNKDEVRMTDYWKLKGRSGLVNSASVWLLQAAKVKRVGLAAAISEQILGASEQKTAHRHLLLRLDGLIWAIH